MGTYTPNIMTVLLGFLILLLSVSFRQFVRAWVTDKLGDPTPRLDGRVNMNPQTHFDLIGTLVFPVIFLLISGPPVYGWGKHSFPNSSFFKKPARGEVIVALSGSAANLLLSLFVALLGCVVLRFQPELRGLFLDVIKQNVILAVFSMLPIPPLDGAFVLKHVFKMSEETFMRYTQNSFFIFLGFIFLMNYVPLVRAIIEIPFLLLMGFFYSIMML